MIPVTPTPDRRAPLVEVVADAANKAAGDHPEFFVNCRMARAAIAAVLDAIAEPSEAMEWAGYDELDHEVTPHGVKACYRAMIAALRKEIG